MKKNLKSEKIKAGMSIFALHTHVFTSIRRVVNTQRKSLNISWMRVQMYYHRFNDLSKLLNRDLAAKIGWVILSIDLMDRESNCSLTSKFSIKCFYKDKYQKLFDV